MEDVFLGAEAERRLREACAQMELAPTDDQCRKLLGYMSQMMRWNRTYNLTAIRDPQQMLIQHLFDSLAVVAPLSTLLGRDEKAPARIMDVGSGGGLPGVVIAVMRPAWAVCCVDAVEKKVAFVRQMVGALQLPNLSAQHARVETLPPAGCDAVISRAFASLDDFAALGGPHVAQGGTLVAMKGKTPHDEMASVRAAGVWEIDRVESLTVPELIAQRCLISMRRIQGNT
jgi:16S rRNA (guanine527-N7)-methyltransferase